MKRLPYTPLTPMFAALLVETLRRLGWTHRQVGNGETTWTTHDDRDITGDEAMNYAKSLLLIRLPWLRELLFALED